MGKDIFSLPMYVLAMERPAKRESSFFSFFFSFAVQAMIENLHNSRLR